MRGKITKELSAEISVKMTERSEAKSLKQSFASKIKIRDKFKAKLCFASLRQFLADLKRAINNESKQCEAKLRLINQKYEII